MRRGINHKNYSKISGRGQEEDIERRGRGQERTRGIWEEMEMIGRRQNEDRKQRGR